jgi:hypothetical protein
MAEPIQSRCILKRLAVPQQPTWRQRLIHREWGQPDDPKVPVVKTPKTLSELREARLAGADPYKVVIQIAKGHPMEREALKRCTMGMSPWILSAWLLASAQ